MAAPIYIPTNSVGLFINICNPCLTTNSNTSLSNYFLSPNLNSSLTAPETLIYVFCYFFTAPHILFSPYLPWSIIIIILLHTSSIPLCLSCFVIFTWLNQSSNSVQLTGFSAVVSIQPVEGGHAPMLADTTLPSPYSQSSNCCLATILYFLSLSTLLDSYFIPSLLSLNF